MHEPSHSACHRPAIAAGACAFAIQSAALTAGALWAGWQLHRWYATLVAVAQPAPLPGQATAGRRLRVVGDHEHASKPQQTRSAMATATANIKPAAANNAHSPANNAQDPNHPARGVQASDQRRCAPRPGKLLDFCTKLLAGGYLGCGGCFCSKLNPQCS